MHLITDTYMFESHFRVMHDDDGQEKMIGLQVNSRNIVHTRNNLLEWVRQLNEMIEMLGVEDNV